MSKTTNPLPIATTSSAFTIATYNVWFGPSSGPLYDTQRMEALSNVLLHNNPRPSLIGFQELTQDLCRTLTPRLEQAGYHILLQDFRSSYGVALAIDSQHWNIVASGFTPFSTTRMSRGILWALIQHNQNNDNDNTECLFTTTHLESWTGPYSTGATERAVQLEEMVKFCSKCLDERCTDLAIITGDLNWDDVKPNNRSTETNDQPMVDLIGPLGWIDAWNQRASKTTTVKAKARNDPGYTYDGVKNPMLSGRLRRRFDRILLLQSSDTAVAVTDTQIIGTEPIPGLVWTKPPHPKARIQQPTQKPVLPSDHFGFVATVQTSH